MKKTPLILKIMPVIVVALPFLLAGCEELKSFFGDSSPTPGYDSSYSSPDSQTKNYTAPTNSVKRVNREEALHSSSEGTTASQSGTAATTVSAPVDKIG